jgi:hypothetical protein
MRGASFSLSLSNKCLTYNLDCARVKRMAGTVQLGREGILRYLALRVVRRSMVGARRGASRRFASTLTVKRLYREKGEVRLRLENGDHGELVLPTVNARIQGRVVCVVHLAEKKAARGRA